MGFEFRGVISGLSIQMTLTCNYNVRATSSATLPAMSSMTTYCVQRLFQFDYSPRLSPARCFLDRVITMMCRQLDDGYTTGVVCARASKILNPEYEVKLRVAAEQ